MHLKKAPVLILLVWKLMCLEAGKFILILYFTPYNRTISMSKTVINVGRSVTKRTYRPRINMNSTSLLYISCMVSHSFKVGDDE